MHAQRQLQETASRHWSGTHSVCRVHLGLEWLKRWWSERPLVAAVVTFLAAAIIALIWPVTDLIAAHDVGTIAGPQRAMHLQTAREDARTQLLTMNAGFFAAGALLFTALNFTLSRRATELTEQGQVTEGYSGPAEA